MLDCGSSDESSILSKAKYKVIMKPKKIKFVTVAKIAPNSKDDSLTKLKPVLGQNQISLNNFISDFNKQTTDLHQDLVLRGEILKNQDKSYSIKIKYSPLGSVFSSFREEKYITITEYQDIIRSMELFFHKKNKTSRIDIQNQYKLYSKLLLSSLYASKYRIKV